MPVRSRDAMTLMAVMTAFAPTRIAGGTRCRPGGSVMTGNCLTSRQTAATKQKALNTISMDAMMVPTSGETTDSTMARAATPDASAASPALTQAA